MRGDPHAGFYESRGVKLPPATHLDPVIGDLARVARRRPNFSARRVYRESWVAAAISATPRLEHHYPRASRPGSAVTPLPRTHGTAAPMRNAAEVENSTPDTARAAKSPAISNRGIHRRIGGGFEPTTRNPTQ